MKSAKIVAAAAAVALGGFGSAQAGYSDLIEVATSVWNGSAWVTCVPATQVLGDFNPENPTVRTDGYYGVNAWNASTNPVIGRSLCTGALTLTTAEGQSNMSAAGGNTGIRAQMCQALLDQGAGSEERCAFGCLSR